MCFLSLHSHSALPLCFVCWQSTKNCEVKSRRRSRSTDWTPSPGLWDLCDHSLCLRGASRLGTENRWSHLSLRLDNLQLPPFRFRLRLRELSQVVQMDGLLLVALTSQASALAPMAWWATSSGDRPYGGREWQWQAFGTRVPAAT